MAENMYFRAETNNMQTDLDRKMLVIKDTSQQGSATCWISTWTDMLTANIRAVVRNLPATGIISLINASFTYRDELRDAGSFHLDYDCSTKEFVTEFNKQTTSGTETTTNRYSFIEIVQNEAFTITLDFGDAGGTFDINRAGDKPLAYSFDSPIYIDRIALASNSQYENLAYQVFSTFIFYNVSTETNVRFTLAEMFPPVMSGSTNAKFTAASEPVLESLSVTPSTSAQTLTPSSGVDGFNQVNVSAVENVLASNIKSGVSILGVTGTVVEKIGENKTDLIASTSTSLPITFTPSAGYNCMDSFTLTSIQSLESFNIRSGITIAGVTGTYSPTLVTKTITENGTYSASSDSADGYSEVTVSVSGGSSSKFGVSMDNIFGNVTNGVLSAPSSINGITFTGVTELSSHALESIFYKHDSVSGIISFPSLITVNDWALSYSFCQNKITSVNLSNLTTIGFHGLTEAFSNNKITSVNLSNLTTVSDFGLNVGFGENEITSVNLSNLTTVGNSGLSQAFQYNQITTVDLSALTTIGMSGLYRAFYANQITTVDLSALTTIRYEGLSHAFAYNINSNTNETTLQTVYFRALTSQSFEEDNKNAFNYMLEGNNGVTVHFPSNLQSVIGDWDDVTNGFGGTNTTVLFDLPATE